MYGIHWVKFNNSWKLHKIISIQSCTCSSNLQLIANYGANSTARESRFLKKLMTGSHKDKKKWYTVEQPHSKTLKDFNFFAGQSKSNSSVPATSVSSVVPPVVTGAAVEVPTKMPSGRVIRRVGVLNTVFLEQITSMLSTGEIPGSEDLIGLGLEITFVRVTNDFKYVNVFWYSSGSVEKEGYLEKLLLSLSHKLRHQLQTLRVIGIVPPVKFVKDTKYSQLMEVERLLQKADFGDDFVPTTGKSLFTAQPLPAASLSPDIKAKIEKLDELAGRLPNPNDPSCPNDKASDESEAAATSTSPVSHLSPEFMRQDMLGLNREAIMSRITEMVARSNMKRNARLSKDTGFSEQNQDGSGSVSLEQLAIDVANQTARTEAFMAFLKQKQVEEAKLEKRQSASALERQFYDELRQERLGKAQEDHALANFGDGFLSDDENEDYLSEDER